MNEQVKKEIDVDEFYAKRTSRKELIISFVRNWCAAL